MSLQRVLQHFEQFGREKDVLQYERSSATVAEAAAVLNVIPARIAKTLSFQGKEQAFLVVAAGDAKIDNAKFKQQFDVKAKMLDAQYVLEQTGHPVGGVCPFGLENDLPIYLDESLKRFDTIFPACGSANSAIELTCKELEQFSNAKQWVDVCKAWNEGESEHVSV
ncbi:EBSC protein [Lysinibacillus sp. 2017]|uniref:YbaK/EbsC family protein n=1 Tax=unclassified Lysinibacillus TaxID=2636778 RepID=UPI000D5272D0|nr:MULTISPECIES: YbaK/EbsC family protein [unclassified Lysinibacillus]AWE07075.1 EBSC protein [Lysinibacillus sp. 2017]TGN37005.1 YbaK/EbsC family protein [Lysinibacillus sp. S2017]